MASPRPQLQVMGLGGSTPTPDPRDAACCPPPPRQPQNTHHMWALLRLPWDTRTGCTTRHGFCGGHLGQEGSPQGCLSPRQSPWPESSPPRQADADMPLDSQPPLSPRLSRDPHQTRPSSLSEQAGVAAKTGCGGDVKCCSEYIRPLPLSAWLTGQSLSSQSGPLPQSQPQTPKPATTPDLSLGNHFSFHGCSHHLQ